MSHTPWTVIPAEKMDHPLQGRVTWVYDRGQSVAVVTEEGDARLIAAAPDLLAALREIAESQRWLDQGWTEAREIARAAIAKAKP